jgi:hypothetical protein
MHTEVMMKSGPIKISVTHFIAVNVDVTGFGDSSDKEVRDRVIAAIKESAPSILQIETASLR